MQWKWWKEYNYECNLLAYSGLFGTYSLVLLSPQLISQVLLASSTTSQQSSKYTKQYRILRHLTGDGLVTLEQGPQWARHKRIIQPAFQSKWIQKWLQPRVVPIHTRRLVQAWRRSIQKNTTNSSQGIVIDVYCHLSALTVDVIGDTAFGHDFKALEQVEHWSEQSSQQATTAAIDLKDPLIQAFRQGFNANFFTYVALTLRMGWLELLWSPRTRHTRRILDQQADYILRKARQRVNIGSTENFSGGVSTAGSKSPSSLLQLLLNANNEPGGRNSLTDTELKHEIFTFLLAGHETTSTWLYFCLYALSIYPDIQEKLHEEVKNNANSENPDIDDIEEHCKYLGAFMKEVLRMYPPAGLVVRHTARDDNFDGYFVPKNTRLILAIQMIHRHPLIWERPDDFWPERWYKENDNNPRHPFAFFPFSGGLRSCVGKRFAIIEAKLILVELVKNFHFSLAPELRGVPMNLTAKVTMKLKPDLKVLVKER